MRSNTKQSCRADIHKDEEDIRQVASTLPASASFPASFLIQQNNNFFITGAAGAGLLVLEISMFSLYDFDKRVNTCSLLLSDKRVSEA